VNAKELVISVSGMLPGWLSSLFLSALFFGVWLNPEWFGWDGVHGLRALVFVEVISVFGLLYMTAGRDQPLAWLPVIPIAAALGYFIGLQIGPLFGIALGVHLLSRVGSLWSNFDAAQLAVSELVISVLLMGSAWLIVGLLPLPSFAWTESVVPIELWWEVGNWRGGTTRLAQALPAWGCFYFAMSALSDGTGLPENMLKRSRGWSI